MVEQTAHIRSVIGPSPIAAIKNLTIRYVDRIYRQWYIFIVKQTKTALIVIDGSEEIKKVAEELSTALKEYKTTVCMAESFAGTELLAAYLLFLGCENPEPASFAYLDEMLQHINLSGRPCGVFSTNNKALKYLSRLIKASGAKTAEPLLIKDMSAVPDALKKWIPTIPESNF